MRFYSKCIRHWQGICNNESQLLQPHEWLFLILNEERSAVYTRSCPGLNFLYPHLEKWSEAVMLGVFQIIFEIKGKTLRVFEILPPRNPYFEKIVLKKINQVYVKCTSATWC